MGCSQVKFKLVLSAPGTTLDAVTASNVSHSNLDKVNSAVSSMHHYKPCPCNEAVKLGSDADCLGSA